MAHPTARKWVITPVINGIRRVNPLIIGVNSLTSRGMSHQVGITIISNGDIAIGNGILISFGSGFGPFQWLSLSLSWEYNDNDNGCRYINHVFLDMSIFTIIWRFPEMGVPPNHPF